MIKHDFTAICRGKLHCTLCRAKDAGRRFRQQVIPHLIVQVEVDFLCPAGHEWDVAVEPEFIPQRLSFPAESDPRRAAPATERPELAKKRFEVCKTCDQAKDQAFACSLYKGCCFGRWRARPDSQCPASPPKWKPFKPISPALHPS